MHKLILELLLLMLTSSSFIRFTQPLISFFTADIASFLPTFTTCATLSSGIFLSLSVASLGKERVTLTLLLAGLCRVLFYLCIEMTNPDFLQHAWKYTCQYRHTCAHMGLQYSKSFEYIDRHLSHHLFLFVYLYICVYVYFSIYSSIYLFVNVPIYLFIHPSIYLPTYLPVYKFTYTHTHYLGI